METKPMVESRIQSAVQLIKKPSQGSSQFKKIVEDALTIRVNNALDRMKKKEARLMTEAYQADSNRWDSGNIDVWVICEGPKEAQDVTNRINSKREELKSQGYTVSRLGFNQTGKLGFVYRYSGKLNSIDSHRHLLDVLGISLKKPKDPQMALFK